MRGFGDEIPKQVWAAAQRSLIAKQFCKSSQEAKRYLTGSFAMQDSRRKTVCQAAIPVPV